MAKLPEIALLGAGIFTKAEYIPGFSEMRHLLVLKYVWSRTEESARSAVELARKHFPAVECKWGEEGLKQIANDDSLLAVAVVLAGQAQVDVSLKMLEAGKHVLQEKPAASNIREITTALDTFGTYSAQPVWVVAEIFRFEPAFIEGKKLIVEIGDIMNVQVIIEGSMDSFNPYFSSSWRRHINGGFILDMGVHFIAGLRMLVGCELTSVSAITSHVDKTLPSPDIISSNFVLENGSSGVFVLVVSSKSPKSIWKVVGLKGTVEIKRQKKDGTEGFMVSLYVAANKQCKSSFYPFSGVQEEIKSFLLDISKSNATHQSGYKEEPRSSFLEGARDVAVLEAMFDSGKKNGAPVEVRKF